MKKWIEKQRSIIDFTLSSLLRRKGKNISLLLVYSLMVFVIASVMFFSSAIRKEARVLLQDAPEITVQRIIAGRHDLVPKDYSGPIREIRGVRSVRGRLWGYYYHPASGANYTLMVPEKFEYGDDQIVAGNGVIRSWGDLQDDLLYFRGYDGQVHMFKIADTLSAAAEIVSADLILMSEAAFRKVTGIPENLVTDLAIRVRNDRECETIADKVTRLFPETRPILREEILRTYAVLFDWRSGMIIVLLTGSILAFFIFAWDKAVGLSAEERLEIGILKAVGWDTSDILVMKFWEGGVISLTAFLAGIIGAYIHVFFGSAAFFEHALKGWAVLYPEFKLHPNVNAFQIGTLFFLTVFPYSLVTIVPIWKVSITDPDAVMR